MQLVSWVGGGGVDVEAMLTRYGSYSGKTSEEATGRGVGFFTGSTRPGRHQAVDAHVGESTLGPRFSCTLEPHRNGWRRTGGRTVSQWGYGQKRQSDPEEARASTCPERTQRDTGANCSSGSFVETFEAPID